MIKTRFFFVIYVNDVVINTILDGMRIIADPNQRTASHITVKGPYQRREKKSLKKDNELIKGKRIKISGVGNFFDNNQNTVYLKCEKNEELLKIWERKDKKTYKKFHPHITIYNGENRKFAKDLYNIIEKHQINFSFIVKDLDLYSSNKGDNLYLLHEVVDYRKLSELTDESISSNNIDTLSDQQRLAAINKLCVILESQNGLIDNVEISTLI